MAGTGPIVRRHHPCRTWQRIGALRLIERARRRLETYAATGGPAYDLDLGRIIEWIRDRERAPDDGSWLINHPL